MLCEEIRSVSQVINLNFQVISSSFTEQLYLQRSEEVPSWWPLWSPRQRSRSSLGTVCSSLQEQHSPSPSHFPVKDTARTQCQVLGRILWPWWCSITLNSVLVPGCWQNTPVFPWNPEFSVGFLLGVTLFSVPFPEETLFSQGFYSSLSHMPFLIVFLQMVYLTFTSLKYS